MSTRTEIVSSFYSQVDEDSRLQRSRHAVDRAGFTCQFQQHFMGHTIDNLSILVAQILSAQLLCRFKYPVPLGQIVIPSCVR